VLRSFRRFVTYSFWVKAALRACARSLVLSPLALGYRHR
jgi:hypothetical protein